MGILSCILWPYYLYFIYKKKIFLKKIMIFGRLNSLLQQVWIASFFGGNEYISCLIQIFLGNCINCSYSSLFSHSVFNDYPFCFKLKLSNLIIFFFKSLFIFSLIFFAIIHFQIQNEWWKWGGAWNWCCNRVALYCNKSATWCRFLFISNPIIFQG